jgi:hypothetical protein
MPRFAAGGAAARAAGTSSGSSAAARIANRRGAAARYSRFEAEVSRETGGPARSTSARDLCRNVLLKLAGK